jgi:hypothetical protein
VDPWWCRDTKVDRTTGQRRYILTEQIGMKKEKERRLGMNSCGCGGQIVKEEDGEG